MGEADKEEIMKKCIEMLDEMMGDVTVPRDIRRSASEVKNKLLNEDKSLAVRVAGVISDLDELTTTLNIPSHTRVLVWNIVSQLETISANSVGE